VNEETHRGILRMTVARVEGALVRVLGMAVRRGYEPLEVHAIEDAGVLRVELRVESRFAVASLAAWLRKLIDVHHVEVVPEGRGSPVPDLIEAARGSRWSR